MSKRLQWALGAFLLIKGLTFIFLLPPWQVPDEPSHVEYALVLNNPRADIRSQIIDSFRKLDTLRQTETALPAESFPSVISIYPPLYHWLISRWVPASSILAKVYSLRLYSVLLQALLFAAGAWLVRGLMPSLRRSKGSAAARSDAVRPERRAAFLPFIVPATALLIPQACLLFSGVTPDLAACVIVTFSLALLTEIVSRPRTENVFSSWRQGVLKLLFLTGLLAMASITKANAVITVPITAAAALLLMLRLRSWHQWRRYVLGLLAVAALLFFAIPTVGLLYDLVGLAERAAPMFQSLDQTQHVSAVGPAVWLRFAAILFVSFWYAYGWMVYKLAVSWYLVFAGVTVVSLWGWIRPRRKGESIHPGVILNLIAVLLAFWIVTVHAGPAPQEMLTQARWVFTVFMSIVVFLVFGWNNRFDSQRLAHNIFPSEALQPGTSGWLFVILLLFLNVVVVFKYIIPTFYLG